MNLEKAKRVATSCLAMTSCGFLLWVSQNQVNADTIGTSQQAVVEQSNVTTTTKNQVATVTEQQSQPSYNQSDNGNYANLDSANLDTNGRLIVSGWHATNNSQNRPYHYLIAYNPTNHQEISRQNITSNEINRPDVARVHNVYGATNSGFNTSFDLTHQLANLNSIQIISRYTNDQSGNGDAVDYWFAPINIDRNNYGHLDSAKVVNNQLELTGWNTSNLHGDKPYHYIILLDRTTNREVGRALVERGPLRPDVAKVYPHIEYAGDSGFIVDFNLNNINFNHELQALSRFSSVADGNSNYVDYYFTPITNGNYSNQGNLDSFNLSNGKNLVVTGWHATDISTFEPNHFLILFDTTANQQVAVLTNVAAVKRSDVQRVYPNVQNALNSGFNASFDLSRIRLQPNHTYSIVSRFSTSAEGNGGSGQYTDFWSKAVRLDQKASYFDQLKMTSDGLQVTGWLVDDASITRNNPYIIILNNGQEIARQKLSLTQRADVAQTYPTVFNSLNSGFNTLVKFNPAKANDNLQIVLRFTDDPAGNGNYSDQWSQTYMGNAGSFDKITANLTGIYVGGWHASNAVANKPYQWLIFIDNQTGRELYRQEVLDKNRQRNDVAQVYPTIENSANSGYQLGFNTPQQLKGHIVRIIHRYTDDKAGNGNYVDWVSNPVSIGVMRMPIDYRQPSEYVAYPNVRQLGNFWVHVKIGQNRVYLMNGNNVVYTMYCSAGIYRNGVSDTPTGTYYIQNERGNSFYNAGEGEGANYWTSFLNHGEYLFHSVPTDYRGNYILGEAAKLGISTGSHGCVRLSVPDAYWFMHNVPTGTRVVIEN